MAGLSRAVCYSYSLVVLSLLVLFSLSEARDHLVGGRSDAWKVPSSESDSLNRWAEKSRFLVGDSLVWKLGNSKDSVLQVTKKDYVNCNTTNPIAAHNVGDIKVELDRAGPFYFISGAEGHCEKGQKVIVVVMSEKHRKRFIGISPAPSPAELVEAPAIAPTTGAASSYTPPAARLLVAGLWILCGFIGFM